MKRFLEQKNSHNPHDDGHIRNIPDWEQCEVLPTQQRYGLRDVAAPNIDVNEVDYAPLKERFAVKQLSVEYTIDDVAERPAQYERQTESVRCIASSDPEQVYQDHECGDDGKVGDERRGAERDAERHAGIFGIRKIQPVADDMNRLRPIHGLEHRYLCGLIEQDYQS